MSDSDLKFDDNKKGTIKARWEEQFDQIATPFEQFVKQETTSGFVLMAAALVALIMANTALGPYYEHMLHVEGGFAIGEFGMTKTLHHWINDGLMTLFFLVVGLELKREFLVGELADPQAAALPIVAAIGGMAIPALTFAFLVDDPTNLRGWGIPMATDIAFALGVIALLAGRVPKALITFLVALAIVDDLGAVLVIAIFYTADLQMQYLVVGAAIVGLLVAMNFFGIRRPQPYLFVGILLWLALLQSGVHATLAGVITAFTIPTKPRFEPGAFSRRMRELLYRFDETYKEGDSILKNENMVAVVQTFETGIHGVQTPLQRLEHSMHVWVALIILPIFALFNAGVVIQFDNFLSSLAHPVTVGIAAGLLFGKFVGITGAAIIAVKMGLAKLPTGVNMKHIAGASLLGGIGFTMSIFIADLAYLGHPELITQAKLGIIGASVIAGIAGTLVLLQATKK